MIQFRYVSTSEFPTVGADLMATHINAAIDARGSCHLALSGGRAPWELFGVLARQYAGENIGEQPHAAQQLVRPFAFAAQRPEGQAAAQAPAHPHRHADMRLQSHVRKGGLVYRRLRRQLI